MKKFLVIAILTLSPIPVWAGDPVENAPTRVEVNEEAKTVTIFIDGRPVARFTRDGLLVTKNIEYGGTINDVGQKAANTRVQSSQEDEAGRVGGENDAP